MCIKKDILATITYFNLFDYPLKKFEIFRFLGTNEPLSSFDEALNCLVAESVVYRVGEFYSIQNNFSLSDRRIRGNSKAAEMLQTARKIAGFLSGFPFVKGVAVSGSLSKNYADDSADIDFFIITTANRLWIARSILHLFKKLTFLVNKQHYFCMNYFIDEADLVIAEKNIYTATEIATLLPLQGNQVFEDFFVANSWTKQFLPNNYMRISSAREVKSNLFKKCFEWFFNNATGNRLDDYLMSITAESWQQKTRYRKRNSRGIIMALHSGKHVSKPCPVNFQQKLLSVYETKLSDIIYQYELSSRLINEMM